jgi:hypothetical protein
MSATAERAQPSAEGQPTIELRGACRVYGRGASEVRALDNVDFRGAERRVRG